MDELVVRAVGGVHALFGLTLLIGSIATIGEDAPGTAGGSIVVAIGLGLVTLMAATGARLGLGEPVRPARAALMIVATLVGGLSGALFIQLEAGD